MWPIQTSDNAVYIIIIIILISYFTWVFIQVFSPVLPWSPGRNVPNSLTVGMGFHCSYVRAAHKQWKVAILILINTSAPIKFRIVEMETD